MNFLTTPRCELTPNSDMTEQNICIAEEFIDKLVDLGTFVEVPKGEIVANGPLFCLPKPGQPDQWRILSDMRRGGQNDAIGSDPTVFPKSGVILDQLYAGGYSAIIDASKFFYQFTTRPEERKYLGCIHPRDPERHFQYGGLPMGSGNSPGVAGRHGAAFLRALRAASSLYQGTITANTWWHAFSDDHPYDPKLGHGRILLSDEDGLPACLIWAHCDDFMIHGPTLEKTTKALVAFMDLAVDVSLLCHPVKLTLPAHSVTYTGLIFDSTTEPALLVTSKKRDKSIAMVEYTLRNYRKISRLALSVLVGTLESLVEATPGRIGHTYLRSLQGTLHPHGWTGSDLPYYSFAHLSPDDRAELAFWLWLLQQNPGRYARSFQSGTLVPSFGDGSGTGTGGTVVYKEEDPMEMWMGAWSPRVYQFSSNWKEHRTLLATLERARDNHRAEVYVERPLTTAFIVVLPRVLQKKWSRASRHVHEIGIFQCDLVPIAHRSIFTIPVVLLFIPYHVRCLPDPRLDPAPASSLRLHHRQHAEQIHGVLEASR
jgi:hypothetical protein